MSVPAKVNRPRPAIQMGARGVQITTYDELSRFCDMVARSKMAPAGLDTPEKIGVAVQSGLELGMSPWAAIQNSCVIHGKHSFYGDIVIALIQASGLVDRWDEGIEGTGGDMKAWCEVKRKGQSGTRRCEYSYDQAKRAGLLSKDSYKNALEDMLLWRARHRAMKLFADVYKGVRVAEIERTIDVTEYREVEDDAIPLDLTATPPAADASEDDDDFPAGETNEREKTQADLFDPYGTSKSDLTKAIFRRMASTQSVMALDKVYDSITPEERQILGDDGMAYVKEHYGEWRVAKMESE